MRSPPAGPFGGSDVGISPGAIFVAVTAPSAILIVVTALLSSFDPVTAPSASLSVVMAPSRTSIVVFGPVGFTMSIVFCGLVRLVMP